MQIYTKESLIKRLSEIKDQNWIACGRPGNCGGAGNTLEDLLGIKENNLPVANANEWELKTQRLPSSSLITVAHMEPSPRAFRFVPQVLLPKYGWAHKEAGGKYPSTEKSFRQTISGKMRSDRGFTVEIDRNEEKIKISFSFNVVDERHKEWLANVKLQVGLAELNPQPYWGFRDLAAKAAVKLTNCFFVQAKTKIEKGERYYHFCKVMMLQTFSFEKFLIALEAGHAYVDFDARTGHNHGTKFRMKESELPLLYEKVTVIH